MVEQDQRHCGEVRISETLYVVAMGKFVNIEALHEMIKNSNTKVYDRSLMGGLSKGFIIEAPEARIDVSDDGRVVVSYHLGEVDMQRLRVLALGQQLKELDRDRSMISDMLGQATAELINLEQLEKNGEEHGLRKETK